METTNNILTADQINSHLESDGVVQVTTYGRSTLYSKKHAGWFSTTDRGELQVRSGKRNLCLSMSNGYLMVSIRLGRYKNV